MKSPLLLMNPSVGLISGEGKIHLVKGLSSQTVHQMEQKALEKHHAYHYQRCFKGQRRILHDILRHSLANCEKNLIRVNT